MKDILGEVLVRYEEFGKYLEGLDLSRLEETYTRDELKEYGNKINKLRLRSVSVEIGKVEKQMKEKEYPQLLGVHNYPILKEAKFLTENEKLEMDKYMSMFRVGNFLGRSGLMRVVYDKYEKTLEWLVSKGILETQYYVRCNVCYEDNIGKITEDEKKLFVEAEENYRKTGEYEYYEVMDGLVDGFCMDCDHMLDDMLEAHRMKFQYEELYKIIQGRDTSLDNV